MKHLVFHKNELEAITETGPCPLCGVPTVHNDRGGTSCANPACGKSNPPAGLMAPEQEKEFLYTLMSVKETLATIDENWDRCTEDTRSRLVQLLVDLRKILRGE